MTAGGVAAYTGSECPDSGVPRTLCLSTSLSAFSCGVITCRRQGFGILLRRVEPDVIDRCPISGVAGTEDGVGLPSSLVDPVLVGQDRDVFSAMTLPRDDEADFAVTMFLILLVYEHAPQARASSRQANGCY